MRNLKLFLILLLVNNLISCDPPSKENTQVSNSQKTTEAPVEESPGKEVLKQTAKPESVSAQPVRKKSRSTVYRFEEAEQEPDPEIQIPANKTSTKLPETATISSLNDLYRKLEKTAQEFTFSAQKDTVFTGAEGTQISIPANAFISEKSGSPASGPVSIQLKEYYSISDILLANLSTRSGNEMLETGGMIYLEAFAGNEKLKLKEGKNIELKFPTTDFKPGMQLFNGEWVDRKVNWIEAHDSTGDANVSISKFSGSRFQTIKHKITWPKYPEGDAAKERYIYKKFIFPDIHRRKKKAYGEYDFTVLEDGTITDIIVAQSVGSVLDKAAVYMIANMPKWKPAKINGKPFTDKTSVWVNFNKVKKPKSPKDIATALETEQKSRAIQLKYIPKAKNTKIRNSSKPQISAKNLDDLNKVNTNEVSNYALSSTRLGWINCDKFLKDNRPKFIYTFKTQPKEDTDIKMVFHRYKSVMDGYSQLNQFMIYGVPENEKVTVVAIKKIESKLYLATSKLVTSKTELPKLDYQEVTLETLKQEMAKLNKL